MLRAGVFFFLQKAVLAEALQVSVLWWAALPARLPACCPAFLPTSLPSRAEELPVKGSKAKKRVAAVPGLKALLSFCATALKIRFRTTEALVLQTKHLPEQ